MNRNNGHDWGNIFTLWACMVVSIVITTGLELGALSPILGGIVVFSVASVGAELVGRK
jgi:hypothetical protein